MNLKVHPINQVIHRYFSKHPKSEPVLAKSFMAAFVKAGIFPKDHRDGLPIRQYLRDLDQQGNLHLIPYIIAVRKKTNTNWFFAPISALLVMDSKEKRQPGELNRKAVVPALSKGRSHSDEYYILNLCDEVLGTKSVRQRKFPFLVGDPGVKGRCTPLPVDGWYEPLKLVVEYNERQHTESVKLFDRRMTVSGVPRGEQRMIYDNRKLEVLPKHDIHVLVLSFLDFKHDSAKRLVRDRQADTKVITQKLLPFL